MKFYGIPNCSTCKKAQKQLDEVGVTYTFLNLKEEPPPIKEIQKILKTLDNPRQLFNTSGQLYRELGLKDKIEALSLEEKAHLLQENGMLIKRPLIIQEQTYTIGKNIDIWLK